MSNTTFLLDVAQSNDNTSTILGGVALGLGGLSALFLTVKHLIPPAWLPFLQKVLPKKDEVVSADGVVVETPVVQVMAENVAEIKEMVQGLVKASSTSQTSE